MVEEISQSTREQREIWLQEAHYNLFNLKSSQVLSICLPIQEREQ